MCLDACVKGGGTVIIWVSGWRGVGRVAVGSSPQAAGKQTQLTSSPTARATLSLSSLCVFGPLNSQGNKVRNTLKTM